MERLEILLIGGGGHAAASIDVVEQHGKFAIAGLVGVEAEVGGSVLGYPVVGTDDDLTALRTRCNYALVVVGHIKSAALRIRIFEMLRHLDYSMPTIVSPHARVSPHATIGEGTIVMHGAIVNARASVGRNCILNSQSLIEHDAHVADHCHIATAAVINGEVTIGSGTFIGSQSSIRQCTSIGARCVIGMGQCVLSDCADDTTLPHTAAS